MSEESLNSNRPPWSDENLRRLEDIKRGLSFDKKPADYSENEAAADRIQFDPQAKDLPLTELPDKGLLEINSIHLDESAPTKEGVESLDELSKERIRDSEDYQILLQNRADTLRSAVTPDSAVDNYIYTVTGEKKMDPMTIALFLADHEELLQPKARTSNRQESAELTAQLASESQYYEKKRGAVEQGVSSSKKMPDVGAKKTWQIEKPPSTDVRNSLTVLTDNGSKLNKDSQIGDNQAVAKDEGVKSDQDMPVEKTRGEVSLVPTKEPVRLGEVSKKREAKDRLPEKFSQEIFNELMQFNIKGMTDSEINALAEIKPEDYDGPVWVRELLEDPGFKDTVAYYLKQRSINHFKPGARIGSDIIFAHVESSPKLIDWQELNSPNWRESDKKLKDLAREVWDNFVHSGKIIYNSDKNEYELTPEADLDVKSTLFFFKRAGIKAAGDPIAVRPGESREGSTMIDTGNMRGVTIIEGRRAEVSKITDNQGELKPRVKVYMDHHQNERDVIDTSVATQAFNVLIESNLLVFKRGEKEKSREQTEEYKKMKLMEEMAVADDNARLITNPKQFEASAFNLRGLHRYFKNGEDLFEAIGLLWEPGMTLDSLLNKEVPADFCEKFKLGKNTTQWEKIEGDKKGRKKPVDKWVSASEDQLATIKQAKKVLCVDEEGVPDEEKLKAAGRLVESKKLGKCLVFIDDVTPRAGHDAVKAYFGDKSSYIVYDSKWQSLLVNTHNDKIDLSQGFEFKQGNIIRGAMVIKPRSDGKRLEVSPRDLLLQAGVESNDADDLLAKVNTRKRGEPRQKTEQRNTESWVDQSTGIEFSRKLNEDEEKIKIEVDDRIFNLLIQKAKQHPKFSSYARPDEFIDYFVNEGLKHSAILDSLKREYNDKELPVK